MNPAVSVVLAARNEAARIATAIDSILAQSFTDWELVVVDDGSTDGTATVVAGYGDPRIRVISIPPSGLAAALNHGMRAARAALVARQDADDVALPGRLARQVQLLADRPDVLVCGTNWREQGPDGHDVRPRQPFVPDDVSGALLEFNPLCHTTVTFRRAGVIAAGGYDERLRFAQDYDLWLRLARGGATLWNLDEVLAIRRMTGENVAARKERAQIRAELAIRARDLRARARAGGPVGRPALRLARRAAAYALPLELKRARRRRRGQAP